jgi:hypothetical protein
MKPSIEIQGLEQVISRISRLPPEAIKEVLTDVSAYALTVLKQEPPQKYVTRAEAYGQTFQSEKQRRWFFAALSSGKISVPYHRTGRLSAAWEAKVSAHEVKFTNAAPSAPFVVGYAFQSRHEKLVGWKKVTDILSGPLSFLSSKFRAVVMDAYQKAIHKLQLG